MFEFKNIVICEKENNILLNCFNLISAIIFEEKTLQPPTPPLAMGAGDCMNFELLALLSTAVPNNLLHI